MIKKVVQIWECYVSEICGDKFSAVIRRIDEKEPNEVSTFRIEDVDPKDRELIVPGAIFHWTIIAQSKIVFSREVWTKEDIENARVQAEVLYDGLNWDDKS